MTAQVFDAGMAMLLATFPGFGVDPSALKMWRAMLADIDDDVFLRAIGAVCQSERQIFPGTNIVALIRSKASSVSGSAHPLPGEAWGEVKRAVAKYGYYRDPVFSDPLIYRAITALGWQDYCSSNVEDEQSWRAQFIRLYESMCQRDEEEKVHALVEGEIARCLPNIEKIGRLPS